jgi:Uma2 family endonuclease
MARSSAPPVPDVELPALESGDRLDQKTFHERYEAMPEHIRAELVGGIVFLPSPWKTPHGRMRAKVCYWLCNYVDATPNTEALDNATVILDPDSEPQPDASLLITAAGQGQTHEENEYIVGAPELIVEVALSTEAIDLHLKRSDYERVGVREYVVVILRQRRVRWWVWRGQRFEERTPDADGLFRSETFPGLWLDPEALLLLDGRRVAEMVRQGTATPEHTAFVARLAAPPA